MNKVLKKLIFPIFLMACIPFVSANAFDNFSASGKKFSLETKVVSNERVLKQLENNISKKDITTVKEYFIPSDISNCKYKYIKVNKDIAYIDDTTKKNIANSRIDYNFRYNINTRDAECLSSTYVLGNYNNDYLLDVSSKSLNKSTELGCAMSTINFSRTKLSKQVLDTDKYNVTCDYMGNLNFSNIK